MRLPISATNPVELFLETGSPAKSLSTKTVILSTCFYLRDLKRRFGLSLQISRCTFQWDKVEFTRLAHSLGQMFRCFSEIQSLMQSDLYLVASSLFRIGLRLPSNTRLSCSFSRGVLTASVCVLHPDSLMMSGACLKSSSMSRYCPVLSVPTLI